NAVRHADPGSTITLDGAPRGSAAEPGGAHHAGTGTGAGVPGADISVANHGAPIAPQHLPHLFDRFYRADPARGNADGSTGLGLAIVSAIMSLHGGTATVRAEGTVTRFVLGFGGAAGVDVAAGVIVELSEK
ncbi:MAG: ATP-binding protein, partial [Duganella sp.]